jgi:hypothetical protein
MCKWLKNKIIIIVIMEEIEITPELDTLLKIRSELELQRCALRERIAFQEATNGLALNSFIKFILLEYSERFERSVLERDMLVLDNMLELVAQQIKGLCRHNYEEDDIDNCDNCMRITYCSVCGSTFAQC